MEKLQWSEDIELGITVLDYQHKKIVNLINDLIDEIEIDSSISISSYIGNELVEAVRHHMEYEESLLEELNYTDLDNHKQIHKNYIDKINRFEKDIQNSDEESIVEFIDFLKSWWVHHIIEEDFKYKNFFKQSKFN